MKLPNVISCGVYREAQKGVQRMDVQWISLTISGLKRCKVYYPDGLLAGSSLPEPPFLSLGFPGFRFRLWSGPGKLGVDVLSSGVPV